MNNRLIRQWPLLIGIAMLLLAFCGGAAYADDAKPAVKTFHLYATDGRLELPDGKSVYIWGYSLKNEKGSAVYPAPTLEVNEGDEVEVTLTNIGTLQTGIKRVAHTIHFHGLDVDQANDGVPHTSQALDVGDSYTYKFTAKHAGTYFYHCHVDTIEHLQMGMHGAFIVKAKNGAKEAWTGGPSYDKEYVLELNEIDPVWHQAVEQGQPYDRTSFHPRYWTINGKAYPDTEDDPTTSISGQVGERVLVRLINAGYQAHSMHLHGFHFQVIASDGRPLPEPLEKDTINIGPGERYDLLITFNQSGMYPFHSHNITDNTNDGVYPGGMHTMVDVKASDGAGKTIVLKAGSSKAVVNGQTVELDAAPQLIEESTYVPLRFIAQQLGASVDWNNDERSVVYKLGSTELKLWIDQSRALVAGQEVTLEAAPLMVGDSSYVPLRFVGERLGAMIHYDPDTGEVSLMTGAGSGSKTDDTDHSGHTGNTGNTGNTSGGASGGLEISIESSAYMPKELRIKQGDTVTWTNNDSQIHTVTALDNSFDSRNLLPGSKYSYTFDKAGTYVYYCTTHPSMEAKIIVE